MNFYSALAFIFKLKTVNAAKLRRLQIFGLILNFYYRVRFFQDKSDYRHNDDGDKTNQKPAQ